MWTPARIKKLRHSLGDTQRQFAKRFRLSVTAVRIWEQGHGAPSGPATVVMDHLSGRKPIELILPAPCAVR